MTVEALEQERLDIKNTLIKRGIIALPISLILAGVIIAIFQEIIGAFFAILIVYVIAYITVAGKIDKYTKDFKEFFVKNALTSKFTDLKYYPDNGISSDKIRKTNMMYMGDRYSSNDLIVGKYKDIAFEQSDVTIEEEHTSTDSDGNTTTYYVTIFKGRWMTFEFNKTFRDNLQVCQKGFGNNKVGGWFENTTYEKVKLESEDFNKAFNVYAENPHEAFYILTPHLQEKIMQLDHLNDGKILLCFINNKLHIALYNNEDSFEHAPLFHPIVAEDVNREIQEDIDQITMFVDEMDLDNTLFKR